MLHSRKAGTSHVSFWILVSRDTNLLGMFLIGCAGAALAIVAQRTLWYSSRLGT